MPLTSTVSAVQSPLTRVVPLISSSLQDASPWNSTVPIAESRFPLGLQIRAGWECGDREIELARRGFGTALAEQRDNLIGIVAETLLHAGAHGGFVHRKKLGR